MKTLLYMTLGGSALALLLLVLRYLIFKRMPSTVYYYAWLIVLLRFALPMPGLVPTQAQHGEASAAHPAYTASPTAEYEEPLFTEAAAYTAPVPETAQAPQTAEAPLAPEPAAAPVPEVSDGRAFDIRSPVLWITLWFVGALFSVGITVSAYISFTYRLRPTLKKPDRSIKTIYASIPGRKPTLYVSRAVHTPLMYGLFSPRIVLPERGYDSDQLRNILRHELTHYRRGDTVYKWTAVLILGAHWFNPLSYLIRRELGRACELSCDETLLRSMSRSEKQSYGNTLLNTASSGALPAGIVATTFSTEKRNLKERLEQIMTYRKSTARLIAAVLTIALLAGCGMAAGPASDKQKESVPDPADAVRVSSVDEFLDAIAPNALILLEEGEYDLSTASNYGGESDNPYYYWKLIVNQPGRQDYELIIHDAENLSIFGSGMDKTTIAVVPRRCNVLHFSGCDGLTVSELTAGHTREPGFCTGGVIALENCGDVSILYCGLYGCGTIGVKAADCHDLSVAGCDIYDCSFSAVSVARCRSVRVSDCDIYHLGLREGQGSANYIFSSENTDGLVVYGNRIFENAAQYLLHCSYTDNAFFLKNEVSENSFDSAVFSFERYPGTVDGCSFMDNVGANGVGKLFWIHSRESNVYDRNGNVLDDAAFEAMKLEEIDPNSVFPPVSAEKAAELPSGGEIRVSTTDEFLKAIGPDRTIVLDAELFDLSTASNYGTASGEYYYWSENYDGPMLIITGVDGLTIKAASDDPAATTVSAVPRYADVLTFRECRDLTLSGFTAGHTKEPGSCSGGVLMLIDCSDVRIEGCRLFGCGILGLQTRNCIDLHVTDTEIFECSQGAGKFYMTDGLTFSGCTVRDVPSPAFYFSKCSSVSWDGEAFEGIQFDVGPDGRISAALPQNTGVNAQGYPQAGVPQVSELENPYYSQAPVTYAPDDPERVFAEEVQRLILEGDWESLADKMSYPLTIYYGVDGLQLFSRENFLASVQNDGFMSVTFTDEFRQTIASSDVTQFGECLYGETFCDHHIAFVRAGEAGGRPVFRVSCISINDPLWPGNPVS